MSDDEEPAPANVPPLMHLVTPETTGLSAAVWVAFGPRLHQAARRRDALAGLEALAWLQVGEGTAARALVARALLDLLVAQGLPQNALPAHGAAAYTALARALGALGVHLGLPVNTAGGATSLRVAINALAGTEPASVRAALLTLWQGLASRRRRLVAIATRVAKKNLNICLNVRDL